MIYTQEQRKLIHYALVEAKPRLASTCQEIGKFKFICYAIAGVFFVRLKNLGDHPGKRLAIELIQSRLGRDYCTLEGWLYGNVPDYKRFRALRAGGGATVHLINTVQTYRHRWLDSLIEEFSN